MHEDLQPLRIGRTRQTIHEGRQSPQALDEYRDKGIDVDAQAFGTAPDQIPAYAAESQPGDVVMFHLNLYHASFGGKTGRRMLRDRP
jgi:ectoine hydroxylase-related dioxygenase (phytanoyl-CoA dioxygenase family)